MDVVGLVVEDHEVLERLDSLQHGALASRQVLDRLLTQQCVDRVLRCPLRVARLVELMDVGEEEVARGVRLRGFAAQDHLRLERPPFRGNEREVSEDVVAGEVPLQPLVDDYVRRDDQEVGGKLRPGHALLVEVRPDHRHRDHPGLARAGGHLEGEAAQVLRRQVLDALAVQLRHVAADLPPAVHGGLELDVLRKQVLLEDRGVGLDQLLRVALAGNLDQPDERLDRLPLAEVVAERHREARHLVVLVEPVFEQPPGDVRRARVALLPPCVHRRADLRHQQQSARPSARGVLPPARRRCVVLHQERGRLLPRTAAGDLGQVLVVGDDGLAMATSPPRRRPARCRCRRCRSP